MGKQLAGQQGFDKLFAFFLYAELPEIPQIPFVLQRYCFTEMLSHDLFHSGQPLLWLSSYKGRHVALHKELTQRQTLI